MEKTLQEKALALLRGKPRREKALALLGKRKPRREKALALLRKENQREKDTALLGRGKPLFGRKTPLYLWKGKPYRRKPRFIGERKTTLWEKDHTLFGRGKPLFGRKTPLYLYPFTVEAEVRLRLARTTQLDSLKKQQCNLGTLRTDRNRLGIHRLTGPHMSFRGAVTLPS